MRDEAKKIETGEHEAEAGAAAIEAEEHGDDKIMAAGPSDDEADHKVAAAGPAVVAEEAGSEPEEEVVAAAANAPGNSPQPAVAGEGPQVGGSASSFFGGPAAGRQN